MHDAAFLDTADRIGARLCRDAIWSDGRCNWLGWAVEVVGMQWSGVHRAQTSTLYDGTAGIALFLARLSRFTQDRFQRQAAIGALHQALRGSAGIPPPMRCSVYSGAAGIAWAAMEAGTALGDGRMIERGLRDLGEAASAPPDENYVDIIGGSAGTIQLLLEAGRRFTRPGFVDFAAAHAAMLMRTARRTDQGWSWATIQGATGPHLCGYGHGASGIGCALLEMWAATGDEQYRHAGLEAFRYERSHFSPENHNWPDLRDGAGFAPQGHTMFSMAWCHGGPGIGLARLRALEMLDDSESTVADLNAALHSTTASCSNVVFPNSGSLCLCHGLGGNADLLLAASDIYGRRDLRQVAENVGHQAIAQIRTPDLPWPCGVTTGGETPNLMLGLAGIGHFFLRLYDSEQTPSVLLIRPQHAHAGAPEALAAKGTPR